MTKNATDVLIVGAGPTGLFLALLLAKLGLRPRIVDETEQPGTTSRALAVQARTLEFYRQVGLADEVLRRAYVLGAANLWRRGERAARIEIGAVGKGRSPFPFGVIFPQDEHERLLVERLGAEGISVARRTRVTALEPGANGVTVSERAADGSEDVYEARYVLGCDGARSAARAAIGAQFPGGTYDHVFYVADVVASGAQVNGELHVILDEAGFLALFPLAKKGHARLVGTIREEALARDRMGEKGERELSWDDIDRRPVERIGLAIEHVSWFSSYHVHHRVADRFRSGRLFLLGDAAHVHSPVGGQGMNTGLGDAMNLAWKLAAVLGGRANDDVLDTYEPERIAFARKLVATTDRVFQAASSEGRIAEVVRTEMVPRLVERIARTKLGQRLFFSALSQTGIEYRASAWSEGRAGRLRGGDRLPWIPPRAGESADNFTPLTSLDWQAHVYGAAAGALRQACEERRVPVHAFAFDEGAEKAGLKEDAAYLVRPDSYIGAIFRGSGAPGEVGRYLDAHGIRTR